mmetsp:Transcript_71697/g.105078  ORF Transcript_71697/g.105078 Transcript_71697/m.105078 type:complete len:91 (+) Transcript_71697:109-381(+)
MSVCVCVCVCAFSRGDRELVKAVMTVGGICGWERECVCVEEERRAAIVCVRVRAHVRVCVCGERERHVSAIRRVIPYCSAPLRSPTWPAA